MRKPSYLVAVTVTVLLGTCASATMAAAQTFGEPSQRAGRWEISFQPRYTFAKDIGTHQGTSAYLEEDFGWGFGVSYHHNEHFDFGIEFSRADRNYTAQIVSDDTSPQTQTIGGTLASNGMLFAAEYNLMPKRFSPYARGSLGWAWVDSGIPNGSPNVGCWWDPWWGYVCAPYQSTYNATAFSYRLGLGVRLDAGSNFFLRTGYDVQGATFENDAGVQWFHQIRLDFGVLTD